MNSPTSKFIARVWRALALGTVFLVLGAPAYAQSPQVDAVVEQRLRDGGELRVIVRYRSDAKLKKGKALGHFKAKHTLPSMRALVGKAKGHELRELFENGDIESISYDAPVQGNLLGLLSTDPSSVSVDASASKVARSRYGVSGSGVSVAVIDSGVRPHTDLPATRIKAFVDFVNGKTTPYDDYGHGTHVAGIIAGSGASSYGNYTGVAPGASIVGLKVLDASGAGRTSDVLAALEWVLTNYAAYNIRVVNLSLGHPIYEAAATDPMVQLVEQLTKKGIVVVVSAGNMGRNALGQTVYGSITSPANAQGAVTVGAADTMDTLARNDDTAASFSSRGPTKYDRFVKPDVLAPGFHIASLLSAGSTLDLRYPNLKISGGYFRLNGTSQAAPIVSGAAALMLQANPTLSAHTVKGILQFTSQRLRDLDVMTQGAGEVNIAGAVRLAKLVTPQAAVGKRWVKGTRKTVQADLLFGETAYWGKAIIWGTTVKTGNSIYLHLAQWDDNIVWGYMDDNIVWSMLDDNIVWSMLFDDNIVWGLTDDNIVWGFDDAASGFLENIVWSMDDNIVWGLSSDSVMAFSELLMGQSYEEQATEGGQQ